MKQQTFLIIFLIFKILTPLAAQSDKAPLDHSAYDDWKRIVRPQLSTDGRWAAFEINPQRGDGAHNLTRRPNMVDLSIRMQQFFDHYLRDKAMPPWMETGIPAIHKGKIDAYE